MKVCKKWAKPLWGKQSCELNFGVPFLDETKQPWYITYELWSCNSIRVHTASVFVLEGSFILVKGWNIAPLNLLSSMLFKQHLSSQTETKTFGSNNVREENKDGGRRLTGHRRGKKGQNTGKAWKSEIFPPFSSWRRRRLSRFRDRQMLFFIYLLWATPEPEKPRLQQFSNHPISKRILKWLSERSPPHPTPTRLHSHTSWDSLHCAAWIPVYLHGWNWKEVF